MGTLCTSLRNFFNKEALCAYMRKCVFHVLAVGPLPNHVAFIMDGNRRYARSCKLNETAGYRVGFLALMAVLKYCYEMGVKYVTVYAFSIDNFKRKPEEVDNVMDLMEEKIEGLLKEESIIKNYGIRIHFVGNLQLLRESVRKAAEKAMTATAENSKAVLLVCVAYSSTDEIVHAVQEACNEKMGEMRNLNHKEIEEEKKNDEEIVVVKSLDIEKHLYTAIAPDPDILVRTSGESRLSNFLLWQSTYCCLYSPSALWPDISFWHLVWGVLNYQRVQPYLDKKKKQI